MCGLRDDELRIFNQDFTLFSYACYFKNIYPFQCNPEMKGRKKNIFQRNRFCNNLTTATATTTTIIPTN